jgi:hypothetical protein
LSKEKKGKSNRRASCCLKLNRQKAAIQPKCRGFLGYLIPCPHLFFQRAKFFGHKNHRIEHRLHSQEHELHRQGSAANIAGFRAGDHARNDSLRCSPRWDASPPSRRFMRSAHSTFRSFAGRRSTCKSFSSSSPFRNWESCSQACSQAFWRSA